MRNRAHICLLLALSALGCDRFLSTKPSEPLNWAAVSEATIEVLQESRVGVKGDSFALKSGHFTQGVFAIDLGHIVEIGDFDNDGSLDAVSTVGISNGGSALNVHLVAFKNRAGKPVQAAMMLTEDRAEVLSIGMDSGVIRVELNRHQDGDSMAGPSKRSVEFYEIKRGKFVSTFPPPLRPSRANETRPNFIEDCLLQDLSLDTRQIENMARKRIWLEPNDYAGYSMLGYALMWEGRTAESKEAYIKASALINADPYIQNMPALESTLLIKRYTGELGYGAWAKSENEMRLLATRWIATQHKDDPIMWSMVGRQAVALRQFSTAFAVYQRLQDISSDEAARYKANVLDPEVKRIYNMVESQRRNGF